MPTFSRVSHISFSVRDAEVSARWWAALLDLTEIDRVAGDGWRGILLMHPTTRTIIEFQQHDANQGETFDRRSQLRVLRVACAGRMAIAHLSCESDCYVLANIRCLVCTLALLSIFVLAVVWVCSGP
ncbi:hypothetical protein MSTO_60820 [Mycobacterium stomatepiae]|uniref:Glyoxalase n=1 Tax=Mycobacterium stomatepiae TaxID=470076 RepID=A0A7I7Q0R5_9MYCO|nr:hypothetical protein MSTO_00040 [Mycobacterium stomatepiae]BBY25877.1 hypothetical protein MSTO_60820 [Mycobacterium stomatepiae]